MGCGCAGLTAPEMVGGGQVVSVAKAKEGHERARGRHAQARIELDKARKALQEAKIVHAKAAQQYKKVCVDIQAWQKKVKRAQSLRRG